MKKRIEESMEALTDKQRSALVIGKAIKIYRLGRRLNQADVEALTGGLVSQSLLSRVESGHVFASKKKIAAICTAFKCTPKELWDLAETLRNRDLVSEDQWQDYLESLSMLGFDTAMIRTLKETLADFLDETLNMRRQLKAEPKTSMNEATVNKLDVLVRAFPVEKAEELKALSCLLVDLLRAAVTR